MHTEHETGECATNDQAEGAHAIKAGVKKVFAARGGGLHRGGKALLGGGLLGTVELCNEHWHELVDRRALGRCGGRGGLLWWHGRDQALLVCFFENMTCTFQPSK
jgi:hypothetical protein